MAVLISINTLGGVGVGIGPSDTKPVEDIVLLAWVRLADAKIATAPAERTVLLACVILA